VKPHRGIEEVLGTQYLLNTCFDPLHTLAIPLLGTQYLPNTPMERVLGTQYLF